jgi:hypothetical protein
VDRFDRIFDHVVCDLAPHVAAGPMMLMGYYALPTMPRPGNVPAV